MKTHKYKNIHFSDYVEKTGIVFNHENRQFGLRIEPEGNRLIITDLYLGANVLTSLHNDLLKPTNEDLIEFAKSYISKITPDQWTEATERTKTQYPYINFPVNPRFRVS